MSLLFALVVFIGPIVGITRLWVPTRSFWPFTLSAFIIYCLLHRTFLLGTSTPDHDSLYSYVATADIVKQWIDAGYSLAWNPYSYGGQPFSILNNVYSLVIPFSFAIILKWLHIPLPMEQFFPLTFAVVHFYLSTATLFLLTALQLPWWISCIGFMSMLLGGVFITSIIQPAGYLCFLIHLPTILFLFVLWIRQRNWLWFFIALPFLALAFNFYIPSYLLLALFSLVGFYALYAYFCHRALISDLLDKLVQRKNIRLAAFSLGLSLLAISPMLNNYFEMKTMVSPTRGFSKDMHVDRHHTGFQPSVSAQITDYRYLFTPPTSLLSDWEYLLAMHSTVYLGILPMLLLGLAFLNTRYMWPMAGAATVIFIFSLGYQTPIWDWVMRYVPLTQMTRHTFGFGVWFCILILFVALWGGKQFISTSIPIKKKVYAILGSTLLVSLAWTADPSHVPRSAPLVLILELALLLFLLFIQRARLKTFVLLLLLLTHFGDLNFFLKQHARKKSHDEYTTFKTSFKPFAPINDWQSLPDFEFPMPLDLTPLFSKKAIWTHPAYSYLLMLRKDFFIFLNEHNLFNRRIEGPIYNFLPQNQNASEILPDHFLQKKFQTFAINTSGFINDLLPIHSLNLGSYPHYWGVDPARSEHFVTYEFSLPIQPSSLNVWSNRYHDSLWAKQAWLKTSPDGLTWNNLSLLGRPEQLANYPEEPMTFKLPPHSSRFYRIEIKEPKNHFSGIRAVEFMSNQGEVLNPVATGPAVFSEAEKRSSEVEYLDTTNPNRATIRVTSSGGGWLVRLMSWHPLWRAQINQQDTEIAKIVGGFQAVYVPAGSHMIHWEFIPLYHWSLLAMLLAIGFNGVFLALQLRRDNAQQQ